MTSHRYETDIPGLTGTALVDVDYDHRTDTYTVAVAGEFLRAGTRTEVVHAIARAFIAALPAPPLMAEGAK